MNISGWEKFAQRTNYFHQVVLRNSLFNLKKKVGREDSLVKIKISRWKLFAHRANYFHNIHAMNCLFFGLFTEKNIQLRNKKSVFTEGRLPSSTYFHLCETLHWMAQHPKSVSLSSTHSLDSEYLHQDILFYFERYRFDWKIKRFHISLAYFMRYHFRHMYTDARGTYM